ncbi:MAG: long-chain fatty acid--CoA ligase, partial [Candidatus Marinimicrobia bacterium]|nr:long-chain fatty acid--CoA ligase [Candidatus Neomarinimicrobiota bacterium]
LNQYIKICIVPKNGEKLTQEEIFEYSKKNLPKYLQPDVVEFYDNIPRNSLGKVVRKLLN